MILSHSSRIGFVEQLEPRRLLAGAWATTVDNPWMPLLPGANWFYRGTIDGVQEKQRTVVQSYTKDINGVTCTVVLDRVYQLQDGAWALTEKTHDYYAQDNFGNVWYFGEDTAEFVDGHIDNTDGTWHAGENGATPGIVMEAEPNVGDSYQQEHAVDVAEDQARNLSLHATPKTPFGTFTNCLKTEETTALEPGVAEWKYYKRGIGFVRSQTVSGDEQEILRLVSFVP